MVRITLRMPEELNQDAEDYLSQQVADQHGYRENKSALIRQALREKLDRMAQLQGEGENVEEADA